MIDVLMEAIPNLSSTKHLEHFSSCETHFENDCNKVLRKRNPQTHGSYAMYMYLKCSSYFSGDLRCFRSL